MKINIATAAGLMVAAFIAGVLIAMQFDCGHSGNSSSAAPAASINYAPQPLKPDTVVHDSVIHSTRYVDTGRVDTVLHTVTIHVPCPDAPIAQAVSSVDPPKPFSIPDILKAAAPVVIAHFQPKRDENLFELYAHGHMNLLAPSYGGGLEFDINLEQLHFTPAILFADLGYDRGLHCNVGIEGKIGGWW